MIINGIDVDALTPSLGQAFPAEIAGKVLQLDGDAQCYKVAYDDTVPLAVVINNYFSSVEMRRKMSGAEFVNIHLTGQNKGGRYELATVKKYQGNRDGKIKPVNLEPLRDYLSSYKPKPEENFNILLHTTQEADDGMVQENFKAIQAGNRQLSVIMAEDKDLTMASGLHCDWNTFKITDVDGFGSIYLDDSTSTKKIKGFGTSFFWAQLLTGDAADNIPGLEMLGSEMLEKFDPLSKPTPKRKPKKIGPVLAYNILKDCKSDIVAFHTVVQCYRDYYGMQHSYTAWDGTEMLRTSAEMLMEQAALLWMRRVPGETPNLWFKDVVDGKKWDGEVL